MSEQSQYEHLVGGYPIDEENREEIASTAVEAPVLMMGDLPEKVDPREHPEAGKGFLQVENQGSIGSCQGQSLTECAEFCYYLATGYVIQFSRMFAYLVSQMVDNIRRDSGSTLSGGTKAAKDVGFCPEKEAPYPSRYPGWGWVTQKMRDLASKTRLMSHTVIRSADHAKQYLGSGIGVLHLGVAWGRSMDPDSDGCITRWSPGRGGHAVTIVGYVPDSVVGRRSSTGYWFLLKNSWGKRWGINGYAYVDPQVIDAALRHQWTVLLGRSDMKTPTPRPQAVDFTKHSRYGKVGLDLLLALTVLLFFFSVLVSIGCTRTTSAQVPKSVIREAIVQPVSDDVAVRRNTEAIAALQKTVDALKQRKECQCDCYSRSEIGALISKQTKKQGVFETGKPTVILHSLKYGACPPCERFKQYEIPKLERAGVKCLVYEDATRAPVIDVFDGRANTRFSPDEHAKVRTAEQILSFISDQANGN